MSFLSDLKVRLLRSKNAHEATNDVISLLIESGLHKIPFSIEFLDDDRMEIILIRDADDPHRHDVSPDDEVNVKAIASIFANVAARRGLLFAPGTKLDFVYQNGH